MKNRRFVLAFLTAVGVHALAVLFLSVFVSTDRRNPSERPQIAVSVELAETNPGGGKTGGGSASARTEGLKPASVRTAERSDEKVAAISEKPLEEPSVASEAKPGTNGKEDQKQPSSDEPPYVIDTPPKFVEKGPLSFPKDIKSLTESTSIIVYLSLSATGEILSLDAVAKGVDELKVEVIKMILRSKFSPAYVGKMPVPCVAECVVNIICKPVDR